MRGAVPEAIGTTRREGVPSPVRPHRKLIARSNYAPLDLAFWWLSSAPALRPPLRWTGFASCDFAATRSLFACSADLPATRSLFAGPVDLAATRSRLTRPAVFVAACSVLGFRSDFAARRSVFPGDADFAARRAGFAFCFGLSAARASVVRELRLVRGDAATRTTAATSLPEASNACTGVGVARDSESAAPAMSTIMA